jgi:competence protein ComEA
MATEDREGLVAVGFAARARAFAAAALAAARDWHWGAVAGKVLLAALGLVILGAIGRSALARGVLASDPGQGAAAATLGDAGAVPFVGAPAVIAAAGTGPPTGASPTLPTDAGAATAPVPPAAAPTAASKGRATPDDPVYLNQATIADLRRLPGVGAKRADAILALRTKMGHFRQIEDLLRVKGVGRASLKKLRPLVRLDPPPARVVDGGIDAS